MRLQQGVTFYDHVILKEKTSQIDRYYNRIASGQLSGIIVIGFAIIVGFYYNTSTLSGVRRC